MREALSYRGVELVAAMLFALDDPEIDDEPFLWTEYVESFVGEVYAKKSVERTLYELIQFGAVHKVGGHRPEVPKALKLTSLGRAWLNSIDPPLPSPAELLTPEGPRPWPRLVDEDPDDQDHEQETTT